MITVLIGISGSGKTTLATTLCQKDKTVRVNRDDIRKQLIGALTQDYYSRKDLKEMEKNVSYIQHMQIKHFLNHGYNIIIDNTHLEQKYINEILDNYQHLSDIELKFVITPLEECVERVKLRETGIKKWQFWKKSNFDTSYIDKQHNKFQKLIVKYPQYTLFPQTNCKYIIPQDAKHCIICDLDGTLCLYGNKNPYDRDFENDEVNEAVKQVLISYQKEHPENPIFFFSGRNEKFRGQTNEFINKHFPKEFSYSLVMRANDDMRKDTIVKQEMVQKYIANTYKVDFVMDDRLSVLELWEKLGIFAFNCNQSLKQF